MRSGLPEFVARLLWDTEERADLATHRHFLIGRVLAEGDWEALRWLRREAGDGALRAWMRATRARRLSRRQIRFWQLLLDLPDTEVESWLADPVREVWDRRSG